MALRARAFKYSWIAAAALFPIVSTAATLPGFTIETVATVPNAGITSIVTDSRGTLYFTTLAGGVYRLRGSTPLLIAQLPTEPLGNAGLLGMAMDGDTHAVVHYTTKKQTAEVVSRIDLVSGAETVLHTFLDDSLSPGASAASEHHGGNPIVADDGSIFVPFGDFDGYWIASDPSWTAGKIWRVTRDGAASIYATGFRNPFDLAWDPVAKRLIVPDNGDHVDDEINIVNGPGLTFGWPYTAGDMPPAGNSVPPIYVFPKIVAPTGIARLRGANIYMKSGYLLGAFVPRAVYYIPDIDVRPLPDPIAITSGDLPPIVDVTEGPDGTIYAASLTTISRITPPLRGDCNGDGVVDFADVGALQRELGDGGAHAMIRAQDGFFAGTWGCDANGDGVISGDDLDALLSMMYGRARSVRGQ